MQDSNIIPGKQKATLLHRILPVCIRWVEPPPTLGKSQNLNPKITTTYWCVRRQQLRKCSPVYTAGWSDKRCIRHCTLNDVRKIAHIKYKEMDLQCCKAVPNALCWGSHSCWHHSPARASQSPPGHWPRHPSSPAADNHPATVTTTHTKHAASSPLSKPHIHITILC